MELVLIIVIGILFGLGTFFVLRRSYFRIILGLGLLGNGANLFIFLAGRLSKGRPPIISEGSLFAAEPWADPLPQALILTAIVISFGLVAFATVLFRKISISQKSDDTEFAESGGAK